MYINENNLKFIDAAILLDPKRYQEIEDAVLRVGGSRSPTFALETASLLAAKIDSVLSQMDKSLSEKYFLLLKLLRLFGIRAFNDVEKEQVFREFVLELFRSGLVDVMDEVELFFKAYFDAKDIREHYRTLFVSGIEKNKEILGQQNIKVLINGEEKLVRPTLQNWLLDYNGTSHVNAETKRRGAFEQANYMLHSENVKNLSKTDRALLLKVIQFYDWLKFDTLDFDFALPGQKRWQDKVDEINTPTKLIPDELKNMLEKMRSQKEQVVAATDEFNNISGQNEIIGKPQADKLRPAPPRPQQSEVVSHLKTVGAEKQVEVPSGPDRPLADFSELEKKMNMPQSLRQVNIQDILNRRLPQEEGERGLKFPQVDIKKSLSKSDKINGEQPVPAGTSPANKSSEDAAAKIEQKLAELKRRTGGGGKPNS